MVSEIIVCSKCKLAQQRGSRYCVRCGEPIDPNLVSELQNLYSTINDLNSRIAKGQGQQTIASLRDEYQARYLALRAAPAPTGAGEAATPPIWPIVPTTPAAPVAPAPSPSGAPAPSAPARTTIPLSPGATPMPQPSAAPPQPVFSWRAFVAEQAIAIMAYLGGFLLLVATLTFEVGGWQVLPNPIKLAAVCLVYLLFGGLGVALRRAQRLQTVGRAYLGVFALMTPLVALAAYRFVLQGAGFPASGMLCLAAFYAAIVYLLLAWRTGFLTYSYLGWAAALLGALAITPWTHAPVEWGLLDLTLVGLAFQIPRRVRLLNSPELAQPATQLSALVAVGAGLWLVFLGIVFLWYSLLGALETSFVTPPGEPSLGAYALASCAYVALTLAVGQTLRGSASRRISELAGLVDFLTAAFAALAVIALVGWLERLANMPAPLAFTLMAYVVALLGLVEMAGAQALRWRAPQRRGLRYAIEGWALGLALYAPLLALLIPDHTNPLIATLTIGLIAMCVGAAFENALGWGLLAGLFLTLDAHTIFNAILPAGLATTAQSDTFPGVLLANASLQALLALAFWAGALILGEIAPRPASPTPAPAASLPGATPNMPGATASPVTAQRPPSAPPFTRPRSYLAPLYLTALGNALVAMLQLSPHTAPYQTTILLLFAGAGLIAGWRLCQPLVGGLVYGWFGLVAAAIAVFKAPELIFASIVLIGLAGTALVIRRLLGRGHAIGPYIVALWATLIGALYFTVVGGIPNDSLSSTSLLGIFLPGWTLLIVAALLAIYALMERTPALMIFPALAVMSVAPLTIGNLSLVVFTLAMVCVGLALRSWRGAGWGAAWYAAAVLVSLLALARVLQPGDILSGNGWGVALALIFAALAYGVAVRERLPWLTFTMLPYALGAYLFAPQSAQFTVTLGITLGAAALAVIIRLRFGRLWGLALYSVAVMGSLFSVPRVIPYDNTHLEALLLLFAAIAYLIAYFERKPWVCYVSLAYVAWAVYVQNDPHNLLPLAIGLAVVGMLLGRVVGPHWSWYAYAAAGIAAIATAFQALPQPGFEAISLASLALVAYGIAVIESRPDATPLAFLFGALSIAATATALHWMAWETILVYAALAWVYALLGLVWRALPWLRARGSMWWLDPIQDAAARARWADPRLAGEIVHRWASVILAGGALVAGWLAGDVFALHAAATQAEAIALLSLVALLFYHARTAGIHALYYIAGEFVALAITWEARWLGADNLQWFILAPGSYQLLIGALLPADERLGRPVRFGQLASGAGALILMAPTFGQSFQAEPGWLYALILAVEALVIAGIGVGLRSRLLTLLGSAFVGLAALRGAVLAVSSGLPVPVVIALVALLLMGAATWLSLRARRNISQAPHQ